MWIVCHVKKTFFPQNIKTEPALYLPLQSIMMRLWGLGLCFSIIIAYLQRCEGLKCYHCFYSETAVPPNSFSEPSEISCQGVNNTLPSEQFLVDCDNFQYHNFFGEFALEDEENGSPEVEYENIEPRFTCAKLIFNGTLVEKFNNSPFRGILRSCLPGRPGNPKQFREGCASGNLSKVINEAQDEELGLMLSILSQIAFLNDTQTVACTCNNATCNDSL